tara:strand:+ start:5516 stop:5731 length:216 start_codon:yes stop_codon:yes gene_type:complete
MQDTTTKTKSIKMFSNAEILAMNSIGQYLDKCDNVCLSPAEHKLSMNVIFEALRQLAKNDLLKCKLTEIFD